MKHFVNDNSKPSNLSLVIAAICSIFLLVYTLFNRLFVEFLIYSILIDLGIFSVFAIFYYKFIKSKINIITSDVIRNLYFAIYFALFGPLYYSIGVFLTDLPKFKSQIDISSDLLIPLTVLVMLIIGLAIFYFRQHYKCIYGMTEVTVGVVIAANKIAPTKDFANLSSEFYLALLTASLFLIVRGFDNIYLGLTKEPTDRLLLQIRRIKNHMEM